MHGRNRMGIDPRIPIMLGRSMITVESAHRIDTHLVTGNGEHGGHDLGFKGSFLLNVKHVTNRDIKTRRFHES